MELQVLICLFAAHILADFLLQSGSEAANKTRKGPLLRHAAVHAGLVYLLLGMWAAVWVPGAVFVAHALIDWGKAVKGGETARALLADQAAHAVVLLVLAACIEVLAPGDTPFWVRWLGMPYLRGLVLVAGFVLSVQAVGVLVGRTVRSFPDRMAEAGQTAARGLQGAGRTIGQLERSLVFLFLLMGHPGGIGFLVAAKSIFRIAELKDPGERMQAEYIILGTLMSFALGVAGAYGTMQCLALL
ncbi:MAG: DUF3307 domain-containing protein [Desulfohalobiaceae bacterium]|nr:DUF3307 domain-containing protein [Desulfohalobiaceae bacterium]